MPKSYIVDDDYHEVRLDRWFKQKVINLPHSLIERIIRQNKIKLNKKRTKSSQRLQTGDLVEVFDISKFKANNNDKKIKYIPQTKELSKYDDYVVEDNENFIIINKPAGIPVQSGTKSFKNITDVLKNSKYFKDSKPFIVHRIDKETSGILIIAKNRKYAQLFTTLFRIRKIHKTYLALAYGKINKSVKCIRDDLTYFENKKKIKYIPKKEELSKYDDYVIENNDNFIVINKPAGIPVQSGTKSFKNITDVLKNSKYFQNSKPFIVHRIDKETSGILIIAKNRKFAQLFTTLFRIRKIHKTYLALVYGKINKSVKNMQDELIYFENKKKIIQKAITNIKIIKSNEELSYVELNPITGRKHQLRKQLLNLGNPIIGDDKYFLKNFKKIKNKNLMLHAYKIKFMINNIKYNFKAKYNNYFEQLLKEKF